MTSIVAEGIALNGRLFPTNLEVSAGKLVALIGPNGGGKTSLLRALARVEQASGSVRIAGEDVDAGPLARRRRLLSLLPASREMPWPISVRDVISLGLGQPDDSRVGNLITQFELTALADRPVNELSTGERARVLAARALAAEPKVLLLDEPLSNLDPYWVIRFLEIFRAVANAGKIVLIAVHDLALLRQFDRALLIADGRLQLDKSPEGMLADERFGEIFRIREGADGRWSIS